MSSRIATPRYPFLSQPPPSKRRVVQPPAAPPTCALPPTPSNTGRRSSFTKKIAAWACLVQPGSPAPVSPYRRPSGTLGLTAGIKHGRIPSSPLIVTPTTASHKTFDFAEIGYNTVFVHVPKTPETPSPLLRAKAGKELQLHQERLQLKAEKQEKKNKMVKKIRSLASLRPRSKSTSRTEVPDVSIPPLPVSSPTRTAPMPATKPKSKAKSKKPTSTKKKALYGALIRHPANLGNELALMQFADGGKLEDHIKRVMTTDSGAVGDVYRDGKGGIWLDRDEELEYRGLLAETESTIEDSAEIDKESSGRAMSWVKFGTPTSPLAWTKAATAKPLDTMIVDHRESAITDSTVDSDLDPVYLMQTDQSPRYHDERVLNFESAPTATAKPGPMLLSLPARPSRAAKHLRKPEFLVDMQAFGLAMQANAAANEVPVAKSPRSPLFSPQAFHIPASSLTGGAARNTRTRRRPAPLKISPGMQKMRRVVAVSSPGSGVPPLSSRAMNFSRYPPAFSTLSPRAPAPLTPGTQSRIIKEGKREFILDSFQPEVSVFEDDSEYEFVQRRAPLHASGMGKRMSRLDLKGIFSARV